jgi:hypothetical protein
MGLLKFVIKPPKGNAGGEVLFEALIGLMPKHARAAENENGFHKCFNVSSFSECL